MTRWLAMLLFAWIVVATGCGPQGPADAVPPEPPPPPAAEPAPPPQPAQEVSGPATPAPFTHAEDYSWIAGRLEHVDLEGGFWQVVYAEGDAAADPHGGKVVLQGDVGELAAGSLVVVRGRIAESQVGIQMSGTYYQVDSIEPLQAKVGG